MERYGNKTLTKGFLLTKSFTIVKTKEREEPKVNSPKTYVPREFQNYFKQVKQAPCLIMSNT